MSSFLFTENSVKAVLCTRRREIYADAKNDHLFLRVLPSGIKSYYFRAQKNGKQFNLKVGETKKIKSKAAREIASLWYERLCQGLSPVDSEATPEKTVCITINEFFNEYYTPYAIMRKRSPQTEFSLIKTHFLPRFGKMRLNELTPL